MRFLAEGVSNHSLAITLHGQARGSDAVSLRDYHGLPRLVTIARMAPQRLLLGVFEWLSSEERRV